MRIGQSLSDLGTLVRCGRFAVGLPAAIGFAHHTLGGLNGAYDRRVTPAVERAITDAAERARMDAALRAMSMKMGMAMLSYARLAGCAQKVETAALAGAVTRLYDDLVDGSVDGSIDYPLYDLFNNRPFTGSTDLERLLADLVGEIRRQVQRIDPAVVALNALHEYQILSRHQREPGVELAVLEKICRGKGAMANLTLCSLIKPDMDTGEPELIMALGEVFQSLDDYMDVDLDTRNGIATLASLGVTTLADIGLRLREFQPRLASCYGRGPTRRYYGMIYFVLLKAAVERRLPVLGQLFRRLIRRSTLKVFVIKGTDALPAAPSARPVGEADRCDG